MAAHHLRSTRIQAILWFLGFKEGRRLDEELTLQRFVAWSDNPQNLAAYGDVVELQALLQAARRPADVTAAELHADEQESLSAFEQDWAPELTVLQGGRQLAGEGPAGADGSFRPRLVPAAPKATSRRRAGARRAPRGIHRYWRAAAWTAACVALLSFAIYFADSLSVFGGNVFVTGPGQQRLVTLSDGSQITMGGATEVQVRFSKDLRAIELDHGEALFNVAHNPLRPFVVHAGDGIITAVGTEFLVRCYSRFTNRIEVWVTRGVVQVAPLRGLTLSLPSLLRSVSWTPVRLASGEQMSYTDRGTATAIKPSPPHPAADLTDGTFIYHGSPLSEVVEDVQRYTPERITLDSRAKTLRYSGSVIERDVRQWLRGLPQIYPGVTVTQHTGRIAIRYAPAARGSPTPGSASGAGPD